MRYDELEYEYELSSGRRFYAHLGILGLEPFEGKFILTEGYDGHVGFEEKQFDQGERKEIAQTMIERWKQWGDL